MAASNMKAGRMACLTCADPVWVKTTAAGKLCFRCESCGSSGFAEPGDRAHREWRKRWTPYTDPDAAQDTKPAGKPEPTPAPRKATKPETEPAGEAFNLGAL